MTDSDSDLEAYHLKTRLFELLYSSNSVFFLDQIARILAVDKARILRELDDPYTGKELVYDAAKNTLQLRTARRHVFSADANDSVCDITSPAVPGAPGAPRAPGTGLSKASKSVHRKTKHRRATFFASTVSRCSVIDNMESASQKGRVGYVCVADEFRLSELECHYRKQGYYTKFDFDVLHIRFSDKEIQSKERRLVTAGHNTVADSSRSTENESSKGYGVTGGENMSDRSGLLAKNSRKAGFDLFVFEYGAIVWWGFDQRFFKIVESDFMRSNSAISGYMVNRYMTQLVSENYPVWCTYTLERKETLEPDEHFRERLRFDHFVIPFGSMDVDTTNVSMLCISHALAQSAKIDYLELKVQELAENCSPLPRELREKGHATITERRLLQLRGEVLSYRLMLKSGSNLMDEPDFFWENAYLKPVFQATKESFEITERVQTLDNKLDAANEILSMLAEEFSQRHGARLEWIVIWLVFAEVVIGVLELLVNLKPWFYRR